MSFHNFSTGNGLSFGGEYKEVKPGEFLKYTDKFDDPNLPGEMTTSVSLQKVSVGTEIKILQEDIEKCNNIVTVQPNYQIRYLIIL